MEWYVTSKDPQGIIADEKTGETIAVAYDPKNADLIASAPKLLKALERGLGAIRHQAIEGVKSEYAMESYRLAEEAINEAKSKIDA
jgi:acetyl/propionyl-CoA carboxylase alpha subunit